jgi:Nucleoside transporter
MSRYLRLIGSNILPDDDSSDDETTGCLGLFFFAAVGSTIGSTAILSNLVFYSNAAESTTMGGDGSSPSPIFLYLNLALFAPMLPITVAAAAWDTTFDRRYHSIPSYAFRGGIGYALTIASTLILPLASRRRGGGGGGSQQLLLAMAAGVGLASAVLQGMLKQLSSMVCRDGRLSAAVNAGMQASAVLVLGIALSTGFGHSKSSSADGLDAFYALVALVEVVCAGCFFLLLSISQRIITTMHRRDSSLIQSNTTGTSSGPLLGSTQRSSTDDADDDAMVDDNDAVNTATAGTTPAPPGAAELSTRELLLKTFPAFLIIGSTVASSMMVASCFDRVPSQYAGKTVSSFPAEALPQVLFYTRLFADLLGRPATVLYQPKSPDTLVVLSLVRLVFVPVFFLYIISDAATTIIPRNDVVATVAIFLFSFSSGYFATVAYQIAPSLLPADVREINRTWQASLINVGFSASILIGLAASFGVTSVLS